MKPFQKETHSINVRQTASQEWVQGIAMKG